MQPGGNFKNLHDEIWIENRRILQSLNLVQPGDLVLELCYELTDLLTYTCRPEGRYAADCCLIVG
jgi:hypothetical protein